MAWLARIVPELKHIPTAIVVGEDHLYGSQGLLEGLRRRGFIVERISN